jgi:hypothetical protein
VEQWPDHHQVSAQMSPFTRYAFSLLIALYGIYQISNDHPVAGVIGIGLAVLLVVLGRRR